MIALVKVSSIFRTRALSNTGLRLRYDDSKPILDIAIHRSGAGEWSIEGLSIDYAQGYIGGIAGLDDNAMAQLRNAITRCLEIEGGKT